MLADSNLQPSGHVPRAVTIELRPNPLQLFHREDTDVRITRRPVVAALGDAARHLYRVAIPRGERRASTNR